LSVYRGRLNARPTSPRLLQYTHEDMKSSFFVALSLASVCFGADLALTPPMGWNSWNKFADKIDDKTVREIADAMVSTGMKDAGYIYINIDDTWEAGRDAQGNIQTNKKFPDMKALADYVHGKGLKIGIYSSPGPKTCAGYEGSYQHESQDAKTWASWGIDYLKYDWCSAEKVYQKSDMQSTYKKMSDALRATGRPMVFSLCQYGLLNVWEWGASVDGNLWRTTGDIEDNWKSMATIGFDKQAGHEKYAGPGHWNDPDMLEVGNGGMTASEYRTHLSLWAMLAAPLLAGNDLRSMNAETRAILTNKEVIAIDQDKLGRQGRRIAKEGDGETWSRPLENGDLAVALFNRGESMVNITVYWQILGLQGKHKVRDLWSHTDVGSPRDAYSADVPIHGVVMLRIAR
jgi:alpha-galactosidase